MGVVFIQWNDPFLVDLAIEFINNSIKVSEIISSNPMLFKNRPEFKTVIITDQRKFEYASSIWQLNRDTTLGLSDEVLKKFINCERTFLSISDRLSFFGLGVQTRIRLYHELLLYWIAYFEQNKIEAVIWDSTPHMGWDNIVYSVAKDKGIKTIWIEKTIIEDKIFLAQAYEQRLRIPPDFMAGASRKTLVEFLGQDLDAAHKESQWMKRARRINEGIVEKESFRWLVRVKQLFSRNIFFKIANRLKWLFSPAHHSALFLNGRPMNMTIQFLKAVNRIHTHSLRRFYSRHAVIPQYSQPYIFFAMHFQPERTTSPMGGLFEDQLCAIDILSKAVPAGWTIYIKEHPRQFYTRYLKTRHYRDINYYRRLLEYKNVKLVKLEEPSESLIRDAVFTATITGSSGWESLLNNKPCMLFGVSWYVACESAYLVSSIEECMAAIKTILSKKSQDVEYDVLRFLAFGKARFITSSFAYEIAVRSKVPYETLVKNMTKALEEEINGCRQEEDRYEQKSKYYCRSR